MSHSELYNLGRKDLLRHIIQQAAFAQTVETAFNASPPGDSRLIEFGDFIVYSRLPSESADNEFLKHWECDPLGPEPKPQQPPVP